jgi:antitoxin HicB
MNKKHIGSKFDDFLKEENLLEQGHAAAIKRVVAFQIEQEMKWQAA